MSRINSVAPVESVNGQTGSVTVNGGIWSEDGTKTGTTSTLDYTLNGTWDVIRCGLLVDAGGSDLHTAVRPNGNTGDSYYYTTGDGSRTTLATKFPYKRIGGSTGINVYEFVISGHFVSDYLRFNNIGPVIEQDLSHGQMQAIENSLNSIQIQDLENNAPDMTLEVLGRNIP